MSASPSTRDVVKLQTWQAVLGLAAAVIGLFVYLRKPAAAPAAAAPVGPAGFGEVAGGGGGSSAAAPAAPRGGEQTPTAANPEAGGTSPIRGKLVPKYIPPAGPGESQHEYEERRSHTATPGAMAPRMVAI